MSTAAYRAANPEKIRAQNARYRAANPEKNRENKAQWRVANPEKHRANNARWSAANPEKKRAMDARWRVANLEKGRAKGVQWSAANPEKRLAIGARYRAAHPEKMRESRLRATARRRGAPACDHMGCLVIGPVQLAWQSNEHRCYLCGTPLWPGVKRGEAGHIHMDHVVPIARGGTHCAENLRPACAPCNQRKGASTVRWAELAAAYPVPEEKVPEFTTTAVPTRSLTVTMRGDI